MESIVKVMKYEIVCPVNSDWDTMGKYLRDVQYAVWKTSNISIQMMWDYQNFSFGYKTRFGKSLKFSDLGTGKSQSSDMYKKAIDDFPYASSSSLNMAVQKAGIRFNKMKPDILKGAVSIPSFKKDIPIPIRAPRTYITKEAGDYLIKFALLSQSFAKENGVPVNYIVKTRTKSAGKAILDRIISGEYTLCDSEILRKGRKWYVCVAYKFTPEQRRLSKENVAGVDVGIANAAVVAVNSGWDRLYIEGGEINAFRKRVEHRRKQLLRQGKYCGNGRRGRGRKTKLRPIETISEKAANFRKTTNHKYARAIVNFALKNSCGVIQMEDLSSISEKKSAFLKTWPYHDLQTKIKRKAAEYGIEVRLISPKYTSQRCSKCGHIAEGNRKSQAEFKCTLCEFETHADYNAAKNISTPGIETLIENELARVEMERKFAG